MSNKRVALLPNMEKNDALQISLDLIGRLKKHGITPLVSAELYPMIDCKEDVLLFDSENLSDISFCIVPGGDGTILSVAAFAAPAGIPILGISLGRVGFMAELEKDELDYVDRFLCEENAIIEERSMISFQTDGGFCATALNDIFITSQNHTMLDADVSADGALIQHLHADGLLFSTPTGSTAYNLAAGGAILDPSLRVISFLPVCPHTLSRTPPVVFSNNTVITLSLLTARNDSLVVLSDGKTVCTLSQNEGVTITGSPLTTRLIRLKNQNVHDLLSRKLADSYRRSIVRF